MEDDFNLECSDDEFKTETGNYEPPAEFLESIYNKLEKGEVPSLNWKCPGYKQLAPAVEETPTAETETQQNEDKSDFDFMDETTSPRLKIRNKGEEGLKGSAKKKTTSLDGVINTMRRHNLIPSTK